MTIKHINSFGIFGGVSFRGVDIALLETDGLDIFDVKNTAQVFYPESLTNDIREIVGRRDLSLETLQNDEKVKKLENNITNFYAEVIADFTAGEQVDVIGVDGLTVLNKPEEKCSYQIEKAHALHDLTDRKIVTHFHKADLLAGGQASPLSPMFFNAITQKIAKPLLIIDVEAVSSLIYLEETGHIIAFDCAPGLTMIEDWTFRHANMHTDYNGTMAAFGKVHKQVTDMLLQHKILHKLPPKSLDIMCFSDKKEHLEGLSLEDGTATATSFIAKAIAQSAAELLPTIPSKIILSGAGTKNPTLRRFIKQEFNPHIVTDLREIYPKDDALGAQITAFNAVRRLNHMHITFPSTTGAYEPLSGGEIYG